MNDLQLTDDAAEKRRNYYREYYKKNKDRINANRRKWNAKNPDKVRQYKKTYWESKGVNNDS